MCVTFTGCELLCMETLSGQQSSHATLKPKLQVQIKRMVMKDKKASKAYWGFVWIKPMSDGDSVRLFGFPNGYEEGYKPHTEAPGEETRLGHLHQPTSRRK